jgi:hypothetical protein
VFDVDFHFHDVDDDGSLLPSRLTCQGHVEEGGVCEAFYAAAWVIGEYPGLNTDPLRVVTTLCKANVHTLPDHIQAVYIQTVIKLIALCAGSDNEEVLCDALTILLSFHFLLFCTSVLTPS